MVELNADEVLDIYRTKLSEVIHENVILTAVVQRLSKEAGEDEEILDPK